LTKFSTLSGESIAVTNSSSLDLTWMLRRGHLEAVQYHGIEVRRKATTELSSIVLALVLAHQHLEP